ncbi:BET1 homolog [Paramacrobiotus metropolitanus]|uniref:BET1 homolog n=1 Tax=Paramacrobiotus metropolitanus TaxID=2943436 RepID=UPI002446058A|nr:BET1 homolog [Paramacrobiotus metropolitanus]
MQRSTRNNYSSVPSSEASSQNGVRSRSMLEDENERMTEKLSGHISALKSVAIDIGSEIRSQNRMLNEMDSDFESAGGFLGGAMSRLKKIQRAGYGSIVWKLLAFIFLFCLLVYVLFKFRK